MRCGVVLALLAMCPGITVADVWEFRSDGTSVFHQQVAKVERAHVSTSRAGVVGSMAQRRALYAALIRRISREEGVDPRVVHAMIQVESAYDPNAVSAKGAVGLMQLMPGTAQRFGVEDSFEPEQNVRGGVRYIRFLQNIGIKEISHLAAAYHAGENRVAPCVNGTRYEECTRRRPRVPNIVSTRRHVTRVLDALK